MHLKSNVALHLGHNVTIGGPGTIDGKGPVSGGSQESAPLQGNKAIALTLCRNVVIRDVTIDNCFVSGHDLGTLVDGTYRTAAFGRTGRIKCGTQSNGGFKNIAISTVLFEHCRGPAFETVDGAAWRTSRSATSPCATCRCRIFFWLGPRMRGPAGLPVGTLRRVSIANLIAHNADPRYPSAIAGIPGHRIEDVRISTLRDVVDADFHHVEADKAPTAPTFVLDVSDFRVTTSRPVAGTQLDQTGHAEL